MRRFTFSSCPETDGVASPSFASPAAVSAAAVSASEGVEGLAFGSARTLYLIRDSLVLLAVCLFGCTPLPAALWRRICRRAEAQAPRLAGLLPAAGIAVLLVLCTADLVDAGYNPFLYFRF